ncbi:MAG: FliH/SctL family protein [Pseudomonadota bacterium]|nr:FliH/SctL family protein [Pseudomonadota bacterium]
MTGSSRARRNVPPPSGAGAAKTSTSPYARFIPREELSSFAAWSPGDVFASTAADGHASAPARTADAGESHAEQLRQSRQSGYQDGYRDGLVALEGFRQSFAQQTTRQVGVLLQSIGGQLDALQAEMAQAVAATAVSLAAQILRGELVQNPAVAARVAEEALEALLLNARHITLRVHPDDQALVAEGAADIIAARGARLIADASVSRGGCLVDSDIGSIDASLETRWRHAVAKLGFAPDSSAAASLRRDAADADAGDNGRTGGDSGRTHNRSGDGA